MPAKYADQAPEVVRTDAGDDVWTFDGPDDPQHRAQRRRRPAQGGVRRQPDRLRRDAPGLLRRPRAGEGHERGRVLAVHVLPVVPVVLGPAVPGAPRTRTSRSPSSQAYNDWHIDEWCGTLPRPLHPDGAPDAVGPRAVRGRDPAGRGEGLPLAHVHREPGHARPAQLPRRALGPDVAGARRGGDDPQRPPRLVGPARRHRARRADGRDDHAPADEHLHGGGRPRVVAGVQGVPRRCRSRCPRAAPAGSPTSSTGSTAPTTCTTSGPARTSATSCPSDVFRAPHPHVLHRRPDRHRAARRDRHRQHLLGAGLPALRLVVADTRPRSSPRWPRSTTCPTPSSTRSPTRTRCAGTASTRSRIRPKEQCTVGALRAEVAGHDVAVRSMDKGRSREEPGQPRRAGRPGHCLNGAWAGSWRRSRAGDEPLVHEGTARAFTGAEVEASVGRVGRRARRRGRRRRPRRRRLPPQRGGGSWPPCSPCGGRAPSTCR